MKKKHFYTAVILLSFIAAGIQPTFAQVVHTLVDGNTMYDTDFGTWSGDTFTFNSSPDPRDSIQIINRLDPLNPIIIDGAGKTIDLVDNSEGGIGVNVYWSSYITIMNLNVTNCSTGIRLGEWLGEYPAGGVNHIDLIDNNVSNCQCGISMYRAGTCIYDDSEGRRGITGNTLNNNDTGINIDSCVNIDIYNNNFIANNVQANLSRSDILHVNTDINFNLVLPTGGNFWSDWTGPDDEEPYGIVDDPYPYIVVDPGLDPILDMFPLAPTPQTKIVELIDTVEVMNLQQGIDNSLDAKLDAAFNALDDVNQNNNVAAINSLNAFINAVEAQRDNKITNEQADTLIADANYIINLLGG